VLHSLRLFQRYFVIDLAAIIRHLQDVWDCQQLTAVLRYAGSLVHWKIKVSFRL